MRALVGLAGIAVAAVLAITIATSALGGHERAEAGYDDLFLGPQAGDCTALIMHWYNTVLDEWIWLGYVCPEGSTPMPDDGIPDR
jgi:hypothetical protein